MTDHVHIDPQSILPGDGIVRLVISDFEDIRGAWVTSDFEILSRGVLDRKTTTEPYRIFIRASCRMSAGIHPITVALAGEQRVVSVQMQDEHEFLPDYGKTWGEQWGNDYMYDENKFIWYRASTGRQGAI